MLGNQAKRLDGCLHSHGKGAPLLPVALAAWLWAEASVVCASMGNAHLLRGFCVSVLPLMASPLLLTTGCPFWNLLKPLSGLSQPKVEVCWGEGR